MPSIPHAVARGLLASLTASGLVVAGLAGAAPAEAAGHRVTVPAAKPAWATAAADTGPVADATTVHVELALELPDEAGARAFALAVSTPGSADYRRYLTPDQWIDRFSPTQAAVDQVAAGLAAAGLTVESVPRSRLFVTLTGSAAQVDAYFATRLHGFDVDGQHRIAAAGSASLPQPVADRIQAVTFQHPLVRTGPQPTAAASAAPCSHWWRQHTLAVPSAYGQRSASTPLCGYTAKQLRATAGLRTSALSGAGQTVAVIDAFGSPTIRQDLATYSTRNGLPAADYSQVLLGGSGTGTSFDCSPDGWQVEQTLDLEAVHAVAPKARLLYVGAADCGSGFDAAMSRVLDDGLATIVSNSWGSSALDTVASSGLVDDATRQSIVVDVHQHLQAAGQGVGLYFASGDAGDDSALLGSPAVDFPASSPFVTAVGGTAVALDRRDRRVFASVWGENLATRTAKQKGWHPALPGAFSGGGGGGVSSLFGAPAYQAGVVPASLGKGMRTSTDVSALAASATGFAVGLRPIGAAKYTTAVVGGTSLATPIVAAQVALAQQASSRRLGFLNPALYGVARSAPSAFADVAPSSAHRFVATRSGSTLLLDTLDRDSSLAARHGYDVPTGLGELTATTIRELGRR